MNSLTPGWQTRAGNDTFALVRGVSYKKADARSESGDGLVAILRASNLQDCRLLIDDLVYVPKRYVSPEQFLKPGDILIATSSGSRDVVGKTAMAGPEHSTFAFGAFCSVARPKITDYSKWLAYYTQFRAYRDYVEEVALGIHINNFRTRDLASLPLPLPPLFELQRIVSKLDAIFARSMSARKDLMHVPILMERYKQSVLAAAFRGDLTADWRVSSFATSELKGWSQCQLGHVATVASGQTPKGIEQGLSDAGDVLWFKVSSMNDPANRDSMVYSRFRLTGESSKRLRLRIFAPGTIIFPKRGGTIATNKKRKLGVSAALDLNLMAVTARHVNPDYLWWWFQGLDLATLSDGSNVPQINHTDIDPLVVPVPTPEEQTEIVRRVSRSIDIASVVGVTGRFVQNCTLSGLGQERSGNVT